MSRLYIAIRVEYIMLFTSSKNDAIMACGDLESWLSKSFISSQWRHMNVSDHQ